jgi:hypothetical protein
MEFDDNSTTINPFWGLEAPITGYGDRENFTKPFDGKDLIMVRLFQFCLILMILFESMISNIVRFMTDSVPQPVAFSVN